MALIVEDGSIVSGADSYDTVANLDANVLKFFNETTTGATGAKEAAARKATIFLDRFNFVGMRRDGYDQPRAWPREFAYDEFNLAIPSTTVPQAIRDAQAVLYRAELASPGILHPSMNFSQRVKREKVGALETEYFEYGANVQAFKPVYTMVIDILYIYLESQKTGFKLTRV